MSGLTYDSLGPGEPLPPIPGKEASYDVKFIENDEENPKNWSTTEVNFTIVLAAAIVFLSTWGSSVVAPAIVEITKEFQVGFVVATLCISLYVVGYAVGPVLWGPASEHYGRRPILLVGVFGFTVFSFASATAKDFQTLVITRFFTGAFGSSPLSVSPSMGVDCLNQNKLGAAMGIVISMVITGALISPVVASYITTSYLGWRWTEYITGIMGSFVLVISLFFLKETYPPRILAARAEVIRKETGNWAIAAPIERIGMDFRGIVRNLMLTPMIMLAVEPILLLVSLHLGFIYGILYLCLDAVPIIFETYGWPQENLFLPYLGMVVGDVLVVMCHLLYFEKRYNRLVAKSGKPFLPEERLQLMILSSILFPIGIFLMCWAGAYQVHWIVPTIGLSIIGFGLTGIFISAFTYIVSCYLTLSASAIAANTFVRSSFGCSFPLFARALFHNLGTQWAGTLLGCLAALLAVAPILFYWLGAELRTKSKFAINLESLQGKSVRHEKT